MDPEYARKYRDLYKRHWWWRAREEVILEVLQERKPPRGWPRILDIGCGGGVFFDRLAEFGDVEGVEPDEQLVDESPEVRKRIYVGPFDERYRPGHRFDLILLMDVVEHLDDPVAALRHVLELLEPGGMVLITVPAFRMLWTTHDDINHHRTRYTKATMRALAAASGLRIERMRYFAHWTFAGKIVQRMIQAVTRPVPKAESVPRDRVNETLYTVSHLEHVVFGGLNLPFGSSLLVLGRHPS